MKLPWDEKYLRISFHVIFTFVVIYILSVIFGAITYSFTNINILAESIGNWFKKAFSLLSPILTAFLIAYLLDPLVDFFQEIYDKYYTDKFRQLRPIRFVLNRKVITRIRRLRFFSKRSEARRLDFKRRGAGVSFVIIIILAFLSFTVITLLQVTNMPSIASGVDSVQIISKTVNDFNDIIFKMQAQLADFGLLEYLSNTIENIAKEVTRLVSEFSNNIINIITSTGSGILSFMIAFVVSVYYLRDKAKYLSKASEILDTFVPKRPNTAIRNFLGDINAIFSGYIRGQLTDAVIMALLISLFLSIINVRFSVIIGIFSGISNLIPYFGAIIAFVLSVLVALLSGDPIKAVYAAIGIVILQQIDGMFIVPRVVGAKVELSPVLVIISLSIAGSVFGLVGMLIAVPICAIIKLLLVRFLQRQQLRNENRAASNS